jgi:adenylyl-sulfate kinase
MAAFTVWFTGLSGSGKSTLARALCGHLDGLSMRHQLLDGDELRHTVCRDLGFSKEDRDENIRRIAAAAKQLNQDSSIAVVAAISPYRAARLLARQECARFAEVFVDCSMPTLVQRDTKGLYRRALAGEIQNFSGVSDPYEAPENPEIHINSDTQSEQESLERLLSSLRALGFLPTKV